MIKLRSSLKLSILHKFQNLSCFLSGKANFSMANIFEGLTRSFLRLPICILHHTNLHLHPRRNVAIDPLLLLDAVAFRLLC